MMRSLQGLDNPELPRTHRGPALDLKARVLDRMQARKPFLAA